MARLTIVALLSVLRYCNSGFVEGALVHPQDLPETCSGDEFFVKALDEDDCQPCACKDGKWHCSDVSMIGLLTNQCGDVNFEVNTHKDFTVRCDCSKKYWACHEWFNRTKSCEKYGLLCECEDGQEEAEPDENSCHKCSCQGGLWKCDINHAIPKKECCAAWDVGCTKCCPLGRMRMNLSHGNKAVRGKTDGVSVLELDMTPNPLCDGQDPCPCSRSALVKVDFDSFNMCGNEPQCKKRQLRINVTLSDGRREGVYLDINDGGAKQTKVTAENSDLLIAKHSNCDNGEKTYKDLLNSEVSEVLVHVANKFTKVHTNGDLVVDECDDCLFALDDDSENLSVYVGLNRAVDGGEKSVGICEASFHWACPSNRRDYKEYVIDGM
ncbi:hypothetical protein ScPMuIL_002673 [Solemya velum]